MELVYFVQTQLMESTQHNNVYLVVTTAIIAKMVILMPVLIVIHTMVILQI